MALPDVSVAQFGVNYEGDVAQFDEAFLENKLGVVVDKITNRWGVLVQSRLDSGALTERLYAAIVAEAVLRLVRNPDGYRTEQEGTYSYTLSAAVAAGYLYFTAENVQDLTGIDPKGSNVFGTARIGIMR